MFNQLNSFITEMNAIFKLGFTNKKNKCKSSFVYKSEYKFMCSSLKFQI